MCAGTRRHTSHTHFSNGTDCEAPTHGWARVTSSHRDTGTKTQRTRLTHITYILPTTTTTTVETEVEICHPPLLGLLTRLG